MTDAPVTPAPAAPPAAATPPTPPAKPTPPVASARPKIGGPVFSARSVGVNEFRIHENDKPIGKSLSPAESAIVLAWIQSVQEDM